MSSHASAPETATPFPARDGNSDIVPFWLAGRRQTALDSFEVRHPYDGRVVARVAIPTEAHVEEAVAAATAVAAEFAGLPAHVRADALESVSRAIAADAEGIARTITAESGKPIRWARVEVGRGIANFRAAAEEARRFFGEVIRLDSDPVGERRLALVRRFPLGPVIGVTPFNFPLNLVTHKIAPALAVGAPIIIKPASQTPLTALRLAELVADTPLPEGVLSVLPVKPGPLLDSLVRDPRLPVLSYTGSEIGWDLKAAVPKKQVLLELGGNAAVIVHSDADLAMAATRIAAGGNVQAGQTCISTQRVIVHESVADAFLEHLAREVAALVEGDPFDEATMVGPLVSETAACRVEDWVERGGRRRRTSGLRRAARGVDVRADRRDGRDARDARMEGRGVRPRRVRHDLQRPRRGVPPRERLALRPPGRALHVGHRARLPGTSGARGRSGRRRRQRLVPRRPGPVRRLEGIGCRPGRAYGFAMDELTAPRTLVLSGIEL